MRARIAVAVAVLAMAGLLQPAFVVAAGRAEMADNDVPCQLAGENLAGEDPGRLCQEFAQIVRDTGSDAVRAIELEARRNGEAIVTLRGQDGAVIARMGQVVMDRPIGPDTWDKLARALREYLEREAP